MKRLIYVPRIASPQKRLMAPSTPKGQNTRTLRPSKSLFRYLASLHNRRLATDVTRRLKAGLAVPTRNGFIALVD